MQIKAAPGDWLYARLGDLAEKVTAALNDSPGLQAADLENLTRAETVAKIGPLFTANQKTTGISPVCRWRSSFWNPATVLPNWHERRTTALV